MKKIIILLLFTFIQLSAQKIEIVKLNGNVNYIKGNENKIQKLALDSQITESDIVFTEDNSFVQIKKDGSNFLLKENSALGLRFLKRMSLSELIMALTQEEINSIPDDKSNDKLKNTAVYGSEEVDVANSITNVEFGIKKLNGAKQLAENGFTKSAVIAAKETFRKYPGTQKLLDERIYFANLLIKNELYEEAFEDYMKIKEMTNGENKQIEEKIEFLKNLLVE